MLSINIKSKRGRLRRHSQQVRVWRSDGATWDEIRISLKDNFGLHFDTANAIKKAWASITQDTSDVRSTLPPNNVCINEAHGKKADEGLPPVPSTQGRKSVFEFDERY